VGSRVPAPPRLTRIDIEPPGVMRPVADLLDSPEIGTRGRGWIDPAGREIVGGGGAVAASSPDPAADLDYRGALHAGEVAWAVWDDWADEILTLQGNTFRLHDRQSLEKLRVVETYGIGGAMDKHRKHVVVLVPGADELSIERFVVNHAPEADAGPDQVLECEADLMATATLDGRGTRDRDSPPGTWEDIVSWSWREGERELGTEPVVTVGFGLGRHEVSLEVVDASGAAGSDETVVEVVDTQAPVGGITYPETGACFGPADVPVVVTDDYADRCDPAIERRWIPSGPSIAGHGDHAVTVQAEDRSANVAEATVLFTIDLLAPVASWSPLPPDLVLPAPLEFSTTDEDGAAGEPVHEWLELDGCRVYDGFEDGDRDGRLVDEAILLDRELLCRAWRRCGTSRWPAAHLRISAEDCGGNVGFDELVAPWPMALVPEQCGQGGESPAPPLGAPGPPGMAPGP
ncbi:MAG: hypothetical protein D6738_03930, partial [Acidobacteria bacterium]